MTAQIFAARQRAADQLRSAERFGRDVEITLTPEMLKNPEVYLAFISLVEALAMKDEPIRIHALN